MEERKGRHNKAKRERDIWEKKGGVEKVGRGNEGRSWFSLEGKVSLR